MQKFNYKYQTIQRVKEMLEKKAQKEMAEIEIRIEKKIQEYNRIIEEGMKNKLNFSVSNFKIAELQFQRGFELNLAKKLEAIQKKIDELNKEREAKLKELVQKSKDHKIFDTLEEKYRRDFIAEQNKHDMIQIDEMATQKFIRKQN